MNAQNQEFEQKREISSRDGLTFVEILMAILVLVILVVAGGALVSRGQVDAEIQKYKRAAIEAANMQMEKVVYESAYSNVLSLVGTPQATLISLNGEATSRFAMTTTVVNAVMDGVNYLNIKVSVAYRKGDTVDLETYRSP